MKQYFERKNLYESKLNSVIIEIKGNWSGGRSYDYLTKDKIIISLLNIDSTNLKLKDSITKEKNNWKFSTFRLDETGLHYKFFRDYNVAP